MYDLTGISASSPIGFLAALGIMRVLAFDRKTEVTLGWKNGHAVIDGITSDRAVDELFENMNGRGESPEFRWTDSLRGVSAEEYRQACIEMDGDSRALGFIAGWATDAVMTRDGSVRVTRFDMTSGQQRLLRDLRSLAARITREHFQIALLGGGYEDQSSFGLDPIAVRQHAYEHQAPTKSSPPGKPGLIWLAFESIPLHPVVPISHFRVQTTGWRPGFEAAYVWPIWHPMLTLEEVRFLRMLPLNKLPDRPEVKEVWASSYGSSGKYGMLYPALRER